MLKMHFASTCCENNLHTAKETERGRQILKPPRLWCRFVFVKVTLKEEFGGSLPLYSSPTRVEAARWMYFYLSTIYLIFDLTNMQTLSNWFVHNIALTKIIFISNLHVYLLQPASARRKQSELTKISTFYYWQNLISFSRRKTQNNQYTSMC